MMDAALTPVLCEVTFLPKTYIHLAGKEADQMLHLAEALEDHDDVQKVHANADIPDEAAETLPL